MTNKSAAALAFLIIVLFGCSQPKSTTEHISDDQDAPSVTANDSLRPENVLYGIQLTKQHLLVDSGRIKPNELFQSIFDPYHLPYSEFYQATQAVDSIFSFRKIQSGKDYQVVYEQTDSGKRVHYFVYHHLPEKKLIIHFGDSSTAWWHELPVETIERTLASRITQTLYHSIINAGISYDLGIQLSEVFAWQVDFFKIDEHDFVKVIFEERRIEGTPVGIGKVISAEFYHRGDTFWAFRFEQDSAHSYFDETGKSLRKAFLKAPLKYSRISSRYTKRRFHPVQKRWKAHLGTDYAAPTGTPIRTVGDGVVVASGYTRGNGNYVKVKHNATYTTQYLHMSRIARISRVGNHVRQGEVIGYVGSTGLATGPHLFSLLEERRSN